MRPACSPKVLPRRWPPREPGSVSTVSTRHTVNPPMGSPSTGSNRSTAKRPINSSSTASPSMARPNTVSRPTDRRRSPRRAAQGRVASIAALIVGGLAIVGVIVAVVLLARFATKVQEDPSIIFPSPAESSMGVPVPSDSLPTPTSPTDPDIVQAPVEAAVGAGFVISEAKINEGWTLEPNPLGLAIENMTADSPGKSLDGLPVMFDLVFLDGDTELETTFCTLGRGISTHQGHLPPGLRGRRQGHEGPRDDLLTGSAPGRDRRERLHEIVDPEVLGVGAEAQTDDDQLGRGHDDDPLAVVSAGVIGVGGERRVDD